jgi:hypothetical protein
MKQQTLHVSDPQLLHHLRGCGARRKYPAKDLSKLLISTADSKLLVPIIHVSFLGHAWYESKA